ncbi:hypothetical protein D1AOALGA4SA_1613 [Olavius algarvensis Delta 1 endosymbiont]|nr:hypothetical protein D1AOALGA4SA_1613 [Olavius algarvensis Delta 1 endosymbiont]
MINPAVIMRQRINIYMLRIIISNAFNPHPKICNQMPKFIEWTHKRKNSHYISMIR